MKPVGPCEYAEMARRQGAVIFERRAEASLSESG
jgi:hypothetical protein